MTRPRTKASPAARTPARASKTPTARRGAPPGDERFRLIFEHEPECVKLLDRHGHVLAMNPAGLAMVEADSLNDIRDRNVLDLVAPAYRTSFERLNARVFAGKEGRLAYEIIGLKGTRRWMETHAVPLRSPTGSVTAHLGITRDMTARRAAEALLAGQAHILELIARGAPLVDTLEAVARLVEAQAPGALAAVLISHDGRRLELGAAPSVPAALREAVRDPLTEHHREALESAGVRSVSTTPVVSDDGRVLGTVAIYGREPRADGAGERRLISVATHLAGIAIQRHDAVRALQTHAERLRLVTRATNDAVWDWDLVTDRVWWGDAVETLFGYAARDLEPGPESWSSRIHPDDERRVMAGIDLVLRSSDERLWMDTYRFRRANGSYAHVHDRGYVIRDASGRPVRFVGSMMDITLRRATEEALVKSHAKLRDLAARLETTREEERTRLAREIHDSLGQILTALKMDVAWIERRLPSESAALRDKLDEICGLVDEAATTTQRIAAELRPSVLDDVGLPAAIQWLARDVGRRSGLACEVRVPDDIPGLDDDRATTVFRILQEALTNILRHAGARRVDIRLGTAGGALQLVVRDDGRGIRSAEIDDPRSLGLVGIRERARAWAGQVTIAGVPNHGTTLTVCLPLWPRPEP